MSTLQWQHNPGEAISLSERKLHYAPHEHAIVKCAFFATAAVTYLTYAEAVLY